MNSKLKGCGISLLPIAWTILSRVCRSWGQERKNCQNRRLTGRDSNRGHSARSSLTTEFSVSSRWVMKAVGGEE